MERGGEAAPGHRPPIVDAASIESLFRSQDRGALEEVLPAFLSTRPWFAQRPGGLTSIRIESVLEISGIHLLILRTEDPGSEPERLMIPIAVVTDARPVSAAAILATVRIGPG